MSKKHVVFIINPRSGVERQKEIQEAIDTRLDHSRFSHEIVHTEYAKHGTELAAAAAANGAHIVVAVGGDGSVNDIVRGLIGTRARLAIIPKGSGNGIARTLNIPLDVQEAIEVINKDNAKAMDMAFANDELFVSNAGVAFDALIAKKFARSKRRGLVMYSWLVTKHLWMYKEWDWVLKIDGKLLKERAFIVNVANCQQFGYDFKIAPMADNTDGMLDIIVIRRFPKILGGGLVLRAVNGTIHRSKYVKHYRVKEVTISHPKLKLMQTDGDAHECASEITFSIKPKAQEILVP